MMKALRQVHQLLGAGPESLVICVRLCHVREAADKPVKHDTEFFVLRSLYGTHPFDLRPRFAVSATEFGRVWVKHGFISTHQPKSSLVFQNKPPTGLLNDTIHPTYSFYKESMETPSFTLDELQTHINQRYRHFFDPGAHPAPALATKRDVQLDFFVAVTMARHLKLAVPATELPGVERWLRQKETDLAVHRALCMEEVKFGGDILKGFVEPVTVDRRKDLRRLGCTQEFVGVAPFEKVLHLLPGRPVLHCGWVMLTPETLRRHILPSRVTELVSPDMLRDRFGAVCPFFGTHSYFRGLFRVAINSMRAVCVKIVSRSQTMPPCMASLVSGTLRNWPKFNERKLLGQAARRLGVKADEFTRAVCKAGNPSKTERLGVRTYFESQSKYLAVGPGPSCRSFVRGNLCPLARSCKGDPVIKCRQIHKLPADFKMHPANVARARSLEW